MKLKKNKKSVRMRGTRLHGWGAKKHKGKGNRGGKGFSGSGKRADQKKTYVLKYHFPYFGKQGYTSRSTKRNKLLFINAGNIETRYKEGEIDLSKYKILGEGEIKKKYIIKAKGVSKSAREKIEKAGGKVMVIGEKLKETRKIEEKKKV
ncbi:uL15 family ribosomal protein [Candidatus Pacearchaeota archaeon]|nr:uL15 family ribosomal protein [Candidatus Pacearchaeota archaeon]